MRALALLAYDRHNFIPRFRAICLKTHSAVEANSILFRMFDIQMKVIAIANISIIKYASFVNLLTKDYYNAKLLNDARERLHLY